MAGETGEPEDRTEAPTARRLQRARDQGQVPVSREALSLAGLTAATLAFMAWHQSMGQTLSGPLAVVLSQPDLSPGMVAGPLVRALVAALAPFLGAVAAAGAAAALLQTRFTPRAGALTPDFSRISPRKGLARLLSADSAVETLKSLAKLGIAGWAIVAVLRRAIPALEALPAAQLPMLTRLLTTVVTRLLLAVVLAQVVIAGVDLFWLWRRHLGQLRMSRTDIKDEHKETEGDPAIKMRIRRIRMRRARQRMLAAVPKATVVITNPTHFAVALTYDSTRSSVPKLVAKGVDSMAARIRETAREHGVPIVENPPLARTLHQLPLDSRIPPELYKAVAEVIAYVWRINGRRR